ncbi:MAG: hypothetical protein P4L56_15875 [Candidatus Sulfopaludibacter sp.]|nr:hypothetical protein [Candidatus Sulfopaludibacter sp.]
MIDCPECNIGLPDGARRCPMCQRLLIVSPWARKLSLYVLIMMPVLIVITVAVVSRSLESRLFWNRTSPSDAYRAALAFLKSAPDVHGAVSFSKPGESVIERWGPARFRVSGYVDWQPNPGSARRDSYSCVLRYDGGDRWQVEDIHIERMQ